MFCAYRRAAIIIMAAQLMSDDAPAMTRHYSCLAVIIYYLQFLSSSGNVMNILREMDKGIFSNNVGMIDFKAFTKMA